MASRARPRPNIPDVMIYRLRLEGAGLGLGLDWGLVDLLGLGLDCVVKDSDLRVMDLDLDSAIAGLVTSLTVHKLRNKRSILVKFDDSSIGIMCKTIK